MGIFSFFRGSKPGWVSSKDIEVGKDYKYLAEYADRRRKGITNCRTVEAEGGIQVWARKKARL